MKKLSDEQKKLVAHIVDVHSAYDAGVAAWHEGKPLLSCPLPRGTDQWRSWREGWMDVEIHHRGGRVS